MATRFVRIINVNGTHIEIELIRDGFNVWYPDAKDHYYFQAHLERILSQTMWAYKDNVLGSEQHQAMFETEGDVTDYMVWRIQRHLATDTPDGSRAIGNEARGADDTLADAILSVLKDSDPLTSFEIRSALLDSYSDLPDYTEQTVVKTIKTLNEAGKIVFRNDQYMNKLYFLPMLRTPQPVTPPADSGGEYYVEAAYTGVAGHDELQIVDANDKTITAFRIRKLNNAENREIANQVAEVLNKETASLRSENARLQEGIEHSDNAANKASAQVIEKNKQIAAMASEIGRLMGQRDAARDEAEQLQLLVERLQNQVDALTGELATARAAIRDMDTMQDRIDDLNQMVDEARQERDAIRNLYNGKHERITELKAVINKAHTELVSADDAADTEYTVLHINTARELLAGYTD